MPRIGGRVAALVALTLVLFTPSSRGRAALPAIAIETRAIKSGPVIFGSTRPSFTHAGVDIASSGSCLTRSEYYRDRPGSTGSLELISVRNSLMILLSPSQGIKKHAENNLV